MESKKVGSLAAALLIAVLLAIGTVVFPCAAHADGTEEQVVEAVTTDVSEEEFAEGEEPAQVTSTGEADAIEDVGAPIVSEVEDQEVPVSIGEVTDVTDLSEGFVDDSIDEGETQAAATDEETQESVDGLAEQASEVSVRYRTHVQKMGWLGWSSDGALSGTSGQSLRVEAFQVRLQGSPYVGSIEYDAYVQNERWTGWVADGASAGTTGRNLRVEDIRIRLTGEVAGHYDVYYRVHIQNYGWLAWAKNGQVAGSSAMSKRVEAIEVVLVEKGGAAPAATGQNCSYRYLTVPSVSYRAHVQTVGWQGWASSGALAGTTGRSLRVEALQAKASGGAGITGGIRYRTLVQGSGWQAWKADGATAGTTGQKLFLEAIQIELTGDLGKYFEIYYRVHSQYYGWLGWAKGGEVAGTQNYACRIEAIQVAVRPKGSGAPGSTARHFVSTTRPSSGDAELDRICDTIIANTGTGERGLARACQYIANRFGFVNMNVWPSGDWRTWSVPYAKYIWHNGRANCYRFASLMCWVARRMGFDARVTCGTIPTYRHPNGTPHGWCEINIDGTAYIYDAEQLHEHPGYSFYHVTYDTSPVEYTKHY